MLLAPTSSTNFWCGPWINVAFSNTTCDRQELRPPKNNGLLTSLPRGAVPCLPKQTVHNQASPMGFAVFSGRLIALPQKETRMDSTAYLLAPPFPSEPPHRPPRLLDEPDADARLGKRSNKRWMSVGVFVRVRVFISGLLIGQVQCENSASQTVLSLHGLWKQGLKHLAHSSCVETHPRVRWDMSSKPSLWLSTVHLVP